MNHRYNRCPASNECAAIDLGSRSQTPKKGFGNIFLGDRAEPNTPAGCCDDLEQGKNTAD